MFDIGFSELLIVFVVALLILGPERLPHAAKTAGLWIRKIRRSINSVQREINAQLDDEEMTRKLMETNKKALAEEALTENTTLSTAKAIKKEADQSGESAQSAEKVIQNTITPLPEKEPVVVQNEPLQSHEQAVSDKQNAS
ncbi:Sec-independent protein translocase protein TatB [Marinomonas epiphytica]